MQRGRGGRDESFGFGDPFASFGGFGWPGGLISSFFGRMDPFDDPFFTQPFGSLMASSIFSPSMFGESLFGNASNIGFLEQQAPQPSRSKGPIIQELSSDDEDQEVEEGSDKAEAMEKKHNPRKHSRSSKEPYVQDPDEETEEKKIRYMHYGNEHSKGNRAQPQAQTCTFHSSTVTYGGLNGAYYTSSTMRRAGGDGVTVEESKEADTTTGKATHRISRGIRDKGHSVTRRLNADGRVDTMQTLRNLNQDDLAGFEVAWKGTARQHWPGWNQGFDMLGNGHVGSSSSMGNEQRFSRGWALPSSEQSHYSGRRTAHYSQPSSFNGRTN